MEFHFLHHRQTLSQHLLTMEQRPFGTYRTLARKTQLRSENALIWLQASSEMHHQLK